MTTPGFGEGFETTPQQQGNGPDEKFLQAAHRAATRLQNKVAQMETITDGNDSYTGWQIGSDLREGKGNNFTWWEREITLLLPSGGFARKEYRVETEKNGWGQETSEISEWVGKLSVGAFVGSKGAPFSEWKAKIERLGY